MLRALCNLMPTAKHSKITWHCGTKKKFLNISYIKPHWKVRDDLKGLFYCIGLDPK